MAALSPASHAPSSRPLEPSPPPPPPPSGSGFPLRLAIVLLTATLFGCDHATKIAAETGLSHGRAINVVSGVLELKFVTNEDTAFGLLGTFGIPKTPSILIAASAVALLGIAAMWIASRKRATRTQHVGFALIVAGALGNVADRAIRGHVVDFIHLTRWPVFNVADVAVVAGVVLLGLCALLQKRDRDRPAPPASPT